MKRELQAVDCYCMLLLFRGLHFSKNSHESDMCFKSFFVQGDSTVIVRIIFDWSLTFSLLLLRAFVGDQICFTKFLLSRLFLNVGVFPIRNQQNSYLAFQ